MNYRLGHQQIGIFLSIFLSLLLGCGGGREYRLTQDRLGALTQKITVLRSEPIVSQKPDVVKEYEAFLEQYGHVNTDLRSRALKRLGDLYLERAHHRFLKEMEGYEKHPEGSPPTLDYSQSIRTYNELLRSDPDFREQDQVLYALSRAYSESGERDLALQLLNRLVENYPNSPHRQEVYFRLGEYYFDQHRYDQAAQSYEQALSVNDPFFQDKAQYKLGWSYFNLKTYPKAIEHFLRLVDQKVSTQSDLSSESGSLVWEALTYVATSFRHLGGPAALAAYFKEKGPRLYEKDLYLMMGNQYIAQELFQPGIETYQTFVQEHPLHPMAPIFFSYVMETHEKLKETEAAKEIRVQLVRDYSSKSHWYKANDEAARGRSRPLVKEALHWLAISSHSHAQESKKEENYRQAAAWYRQFLMEFPQEKESQEIHLFLAEALFELKDYAQAASAYEVAAYGYPNKNIDRKAAYTAVVAYEKVQTKEGKRKVIQLAQRFADRFPQDPQAPTVLLKAGELLFEMQHYSEARQVLENFLTRYPKQGKSAKAQKLIAHSYMQEGHYSEAQKAYSQALVLVPSSDSVERKNLTDLMAAAIYKQGEQYKKESKLEEAARVFEEISQEAPESDLAPTALFEAGTLYETRKRFEEAIGIYQKLTRRYPNSRLVGKAYIQMGLLHEQQGQNVTAADAFDAASHSVQDPEQMAQLLWAAGLLYEKGSQWEKSYSSFSKFTGRFPQHPNVTEALFKMALVHQKQGRVKEALQLFEKVEQKYPGTPFAAQAIFQVAEESFKEFKKIKLKEPLPKSFKKKTQALEKTVTLYTRAAETRYLEVVTVSAYRLGEVFEHFKASLLESEHPKKLNKEQMEEYLFQLEEKAFPFEEKAVQAYASNVQRTQAQPGLYDDWVRKSYDRLAELRPVLYRRPERTERITSNINPEILSAKSSSGPITRILKAEQ
jgi:tetratricopeptide (TPR) repeat protein